MRKAWVVARHEYLVGLRRTGFIIMTALLPLLGLLALVVVAFFSGQAGSFFERQFVPQSGQVGVVDRQGSFSPILPAYRDDFRLFPDEQTGRAAVQAGEAAGLLIIPQDYVASGRVTLVSKESGLGTTVGGTGRLRAFLVTHLLRDKLDQPLRERVADPYDLTVVSLEGEGQAGLESQALAINAIANTVAAYVLGLLLVITIFVSSGYLLRGVSEEKATRVIEIVLSSVTATELLAGKVLGLGALGLTQVIVWLASAFALSRGAEVLLGVSVPLAARPEVFAMGLVYYLLGFLVYAVLLAGVGALGTTERESQQLGGIFSMMAAIPLMLGGMVIMSPNATLFRVLSWFPLTAPTTMLLRFPMAEVPLVDVVGSIVVLIVFIPVLLLAGARVFRLGLLMYGKRATARQVLRALREG